MAPHETRQALRPFDVPYLASEFCGKHMPEGPSVDFIKFLLIPKQRYSIILQLKDGLLSVVDIATSPSRF